MIRVTTTLTERQIERLDREKERTGLNKADIIRRAVDRYLDDMREREAA